MKRYLHLYISVTNALNCPIATLTGLKRKHECMTKQVCRKTLVTCLMQPKR